MEGKGRGRCAVWYVCTYVCVRGLQELGDEREGEGSEKGCGRIEGTGNDERDEDRNEWRTVEEIDRRLGVDRPV